MKFEEKNCEKSQNFGNQKISDSGYIPGFIDTLEIQANMSGRKPTLLILSHELIFHSVNAANIQSKLIQIINRGYDKPRYKYNVIKTARIKFSLGTDLEIQDKKEAVIGICVHHDPLWVKDDAPIFNVHDIEIKYVNDLNFDITDEIFSSVIGSVGLKPIEAGVMEITALTSFYPKLGSVLVELIEKYMLDKLVAYNTLYAHVIEDHELVPFYSKVGFEIIETSVVEIDPQTGKVVGGDLEDGIELTKSFSLVLMKKKLITV